MLLFVRFWALSRLKQWSALQFIVIHLTHLFVIALCCLIVARRVFGNVVFIHSEVPTSKTENDFVQFASAKYIDHYSRVGVMINRFV